MVDIGLEFEVGETEDDLEFDAQDYVGLSAYQIAVKHGYKGTEEQWIASISKTKTSQLANDGDGKSPFATEAYVDEHSSTGGTTDYNQLTNKPKINGVELSGEVELAVPHSTSELNNDGNGNSPFATKTEVEEAIAAVPAPQVPTKTSELENDGDGTSSFATQQDVADAVKDKLTIVTNTTTATKAYIAKTDGTQGTIDVATGVAANTLAQRGAGGALAVGAATADNDAVNLAYANAHYAAAEKVQNKLDKNKGGWSVYEPYRKAYIVTRGGGQDTLYISEHSESNGYNSNWIVGYSSEGNLLCTSINWEREPGQSSHFVTNKGYVDAADNKIKDIVSKQAADIELLYTLIENTIITNTTVEDTYTSRVTAGGLPVVSNTPTTVHKITGASAASINLAKLANGTFTSNGVTFVSSSETGAVHISGSLNEGATYASLTVSHFSLRQGTYTLYAPHKVDKVSWIVRNEQNEKVESLSWNGTDTVKSFTVSADGSYNLYIYINESLSIVLDYTETPMLLHGDRTASLPAFEPYYADIKSAGFNRIISTGRNVLHSTESTNVTRGGLTYTADASTGIVTITGTKTSGDSVASLLGSFDLPKGTYTLYLPHKIQGIGWAVKTMAHAQVGSLSWNTDSKFSSFTVETAGRFYLLAYAIGDGLTVNYTDTPMILPGIVTENFPDFEMYREDTSFALASPITLCKWDYIDIDNQRIVTGTVEVTQDTAFTDEELVTYPAGYILSADRKTIAYPLETPTTAPLTVPQTYTVWRNGLEMVDTGENDALLPTITQSYYEEVASNQ